MTSFPAEGDGVFNEVFRALPLHHFPAPTAGAVTTINSDTSVSDALALLSQGKL